MSDQGRRAAVVSTPPGDLNRPLVLNRPFDLIDDQHGFRSPPSLQHEAELIMQRFHKVRRRGFRIGRVWCPFNREVERTAETRPVDYPTIERDTMAAAAEVIRKHFDELGQRQAPADQTAGVPDRPHGEDAPGIDVQSICDGAIRGPRLPSDREETSA